jgi:hypothetical protein
MDRPRSPVVDTQCASAELSHAWITTPVSGSPKSGSCLCYSPESSSFPQKSPGSRPPPPGRDAVSEPGRTIPGILHSSTLTAEGGGRHNGLSRWPAKTQGNSGQGTLSARSSPGYRPPRLRIPLRERQREARQEWILMRVTSIILILTALAVLVIISLMIATQS